MWKRNHSSISLYEIKKERPGFVGDNHESENAHYVAVTRNFGSAYTENENGWPVVEAHVAFTTDEIGRATTFAKKLRALIDEEFKNADKD